MKSDAVGPRTSRPTRWVCPLPSSPNFGLFVYEQPDAFLDVREAQAPYFASLWPAGVALAAEIFASERLSTPFHGARVLDLGCGLGVVGLAAGSQGADVTLVDYEAECVDMVNASAHALDLAPQVIVHDWREPLLLDAFDVVLAADVLYERANHAHVASCISRALTPKGCAWIADPSRPAAPAFLRALATYGLECRDRWRSTAAPNDVRVDVYEIVRATTMCESTP